MLKFVKRWIWRRGKVKLLGFTLTELLVALVVSSIILTSLLFFTTSLVTTNRDEEVKAATQDEIASALNFIAADMQEAIYIYDGQAIARASNPADPPNSGIRDQLPYQPETDTNVDRRNSLTPVLVFWKRSNLRAGLKGENCSAGDTGTIKDFDFVYTAGRPSTTNGRCVRCLPHPYPNHTRTSDCFGQDRFRYDLVVYFLVKKTGSYTNVFSNSAQIARWELKGGIPWTCVSSLNEDQGGLTQAAAETQPGNPTKCPIQDKVFVDDDGDPLTPKTLYAVPPDKGFRLFKTGSSSQLRASMNTWRKSPEAYDYSANGLEVLIDFVDDTPYHPNHDVNGGAPISIPVRPNQTDNPDEPVNPDCDDPRRGLGSPVPGAASRVPAQFATTGSNEALKLSSFYACVANFINESDMSTSAARIWIRGNPKARLTDNINLRPIGITGSPNDTNLVTSDTRVLARGTFKLD